MTDKKKKILFVATVVKTHINAFHLPFLQMFKEQDWEVHVAAKNDFVDEPCVIPNCDKHFDINFERSPFSKNNIRAYQELKQIIKDNNYDIIHCHTPVAGVLVRLAAKNLKNTTIIYTAHGFHFYEGAPLLNWLLYYPVERLCARYTDKLITINQEDFKRVQNWSLRGNGQVYYVPGVGVDVEKFNIKSIDKKYKRKELGINKNTKIILSVGELITRKNHEIIIKALSKIKNKDYIYLICGRGKLLEQLKNLSVKLDIEKKVKFLGFREDIVEICAIADLFVFPSIHEGLPVALMEAMACGTPCLASNVRGNRDLLDASNLCKSNTEDEWVELLKENLDSEIRVVNLSPQYELNAIKHTMNTIYNI